MFSADDILPLLRQHGGWALLSLALLWFFWRLRRAPKEYPYRPRKAIMTANERDFYHALLDAVGKDYDIFGMVRMADLLEVEPGAGQRQRWQARINGKHIDFVLCGRDTQAAVLAIEVDDRSHQRRDRQERDYFVDRAFAAAQLPLLRVHAARHYCSRELRKAIQQELHRKPTRKLAAERRVSVARSA